VLNTWQTVSGIVTATTDFITIFLDGQYKPANVFGPATLWIDGVTLDPYTGPLPPPPLPVVDNPVSKRPWLPGASGQAPAATATGSNATS